MVVNCAACYNRLKTANHEVSTSPAMRERWPMPSGSDYDGSVAVRHFVEVLLEDIGIDKLRKSFKQSLNGLKVACYYGCFLVRPPEVTSFDDPENPTIAGPSGEAMGGESLDWPGKVDCCGGGLNLTRTDVVVKLSGLDYRDGQSRRRRLHRSGLPHVPDQPGPAAERYRESRPARRYNMPIVYITQLLGLCLGIPPKELGLNRLMVPPSAVIKAIERNSLTA